MSGDWITSQQVEVYMKVRRTGKTQEVSAAKAGISERSGREIEQQRRTDPRRKSRRWKTRQDPFEEVWLRELVPLLQNEPNLAPITLLEYLQSKYSGHYPDKLLRTLQRRVKQWRAEFGPAQDVMFRQEHHAGQQGLSDFTTLKGLTVTVRGKPLSHLLYHFRLAYSRWSHMRVVLGGESFTALTESLQDALWRLGGSPLEHRTDSLSAAFKNLSKDEQADITQGYENFCAHYSMKATRNNLGQKHENGSIESPHGHLKKRIAQAFLLRGSYDFDSVEAYQQWLDEVVKGHNQRNAKMIDIERRALQPLPQHKTVDYSELVVKVTSSSTISVRASLYTVPSRLIGHSLRVRLYHDRLECFLGSACVIILARVYGTRQKRRARRVDYRHVIQSLVKKPQAFRGSQIRDDLLPNPIYQKIWEHVDSKMSPKAACKLMVGILYLAATEDCEEEIAWWVSEAIANGEVITLTKLQNKYRAPPSLQIDVDVQQHCLADYNHLIPNCLEVSHA